MKKKLTRIHRSNPFDDMDVSLKETTKKKYKDPDTWTIVSALNRVLDQARYSELSEEFWESCKTPLAYLREQLKLTDIQIVFLAIMIEAGEPMSWRKFGNFLGCSRLSMMVYSEEIEELLTKRWCVRRGTHEMSGRYEGFALVHGVVTALRHNKVFEPERLDGMDMQQFIDKLESHLDKTVNNHNAEFSDDEEWMMLLTKANPNLPLCQEVLGFDDLHVQTLLLMAVFDYAQWANSDDEGMTISFLDDLYPEDCKCGNLRRKLRDGSHILIRKGYLEYKCEDGVADNEHYMLTKKVKEELLSAYSPSRSRVRSPQKDNRFLKHSASIKEKELFYNDSEAKQIERLTNLLSVENLPSVQQRLEEQGLRKGFACLFYGSPGTGKTETVLQIARKTGRDIMQIDIAGMRDKFVGESEKNIKAVFSRYRELCKNSEVLPILFFNEADALINKRTENIQHSVDKMDNAMQNIILQEMEDLDGILIATTNLTANLDNAFDRRFLFKVEFSKPDVEVKAKIWSSMLKNISDDDAHTLASKFDFSGGQIENVARKRTIDFILNGEFADINGIESYCHNEQLENKKKRRPIVGFQI